MPCAPGTVFNPAIGVCDFPNNVPGCGLVQSTTQQPTTQPSSSPSTDGECLPNYMFLSERYAFQQ